MKGKMMGRLHNYHANFYLIWSWNLISINPLKIPLQM